MTTGARALYEGSGTAAGKQDTWHQECHRVECEEGAITIGRDRVSRVHRYTPGEGLTTEEVIPASDRSTEGTSGCSAGF